MAKQPMREVSPSTAGNIELPSVYIAGDYLDQVSMVRSTTMSMGLNVGRLESEGSKPGKENEEWEKVLIPFVTVNVNAAPFESSEETGEAGSILRETLPLENAAFLVWDLSFELFEAINDLGDFSTGRIPVEPRRLKATAQILTAARLKMDQSLAALREMGATVPET